MTSMSITVNEYTSRVLGVVKEKYGLKTKAEALDRFVDMYGDQFVEKEIKEEIMAKMKKDTKEWESKHNFKRKMSTKELDKITGVG